MFFSTNTLNEFYKQLQLTRSGKVGLERTTGLTVFLALDQLQKKTGHDIINLHPDSPLRGEMTKIFINLLLVTEQDGIEYQASNLGYIEKGAKTLDKKFSSNFLTVPLKRGALVEKIQQYPKRPAPLLNLGQRVTSYGNWGANKCRSWSDNFYQFMEGRECGNNLFPLIVFLLREYDFSSLIGEPKNILYEALSKSYTDEVCSFLIENANIPDTWNIDEYFSGTKSLLTIEFFLSLSEHVEEETTYDEIKIDPNIYTQIETALKSGNHVILIGAPGTGKTTIAIAVAEKLNKGMYELFTATSNWSTFEVLGGYFPNPLNPELLQYEPGFMCICIETNKWVIIDEINRADVDKAFGELFTVLSGKSVFLPFYKIEKDGSDKYITKRIVIIAEESNEPKSEEQIEKYIISKDWRIIGTMNTFDKSSLYQLSYAFMRRFAFIEIDVPEIDEMRHLIYERVDKINESEILKNKIIFYVERIFCEGLYQIGFPVGPAIPFKVIDYISIKISDTNSTNEENVRKAVIEGIFMFLLPQFEGRRYLCDQLKTIIIEALEISDEKEKLNIEKRIVSWTGNLYGG